MQLNRNVANELKINWKTNHIPIISNYLSLSNLSATCFPIAPITPPPGWALLPQIHTPPTLPLILFTNKLSIPILPWKMLPSVMFSSFSKSKGVKMSMKWTMFSNGSSRYWLISLKNARLMSSWEIGVAGSPLFGWYGVYCIRQFMMWYPSGARVLSKTDGIVISKKGFKLILFFKVFLY